MPPKAKPAASGDLVNLQVEQWPVSKLRRYPGNAKVHPETQVGEISASIGEFGFISPILVDGKGEIIAGHGRLDAAEARKMKKVPVIQLGHLSEAQVKALRIADNSLGASGTSWNADLLDSELAQLRALDFNLEPLGLHNIELPDLDEPVQPPPRANRSKTTIFLSVKNADAEKARKAVVTALDKVGISHNL